VTLDRLKEILAEGSSALLALSAEESGEAVITIAPEQVLETARELHGLGFERLDMVTAVDRGDTFELIYRVESRSLSGALFVRAPLSREEPRVASVYQVWPAADWQEREIYDLFGIEFQGHPDLRRIFLPEDFDGHPLRRDYDDPRLIRRPDYI